MRRPGSVWFTLHQGGAAIHTDDITNFPEDTDCLIAACLLLAACQSVPAVVLLATPGSPALPCIVSVARRVHRVGRVLECVFECGSVVIVSCVGLVECGPCRGGRGWRPLLLHTLLSQCGGVTHHSSAAARRVRREGRRRPHGNHPHQR